MTMYHLATAIEASPLGQVIRESTWMFPAIEATHLLALALLGGAVLVVALAVLGVGLKTPPSELHMSARPYMTGSVITLLVTGVLLGVSEPVKLYGREAFWVKMISLALALLFTYLVFYPRVRRGESGAAVRAAAGVTLVLWLVVAVSGRWIGFS
jgi:hypothetical protein